MPVADDLLNPKKSSPLRPLLVLVVLAGLGAGAFFLGRLTAAPEAPPPAPVVEAPPPAPAPPPPPPAPAEVKMGEVIPGTEGLRRVATMIEGSLESSVVGVAGPEVGPALAQVSTRLLVWNLNVQRQVHKGDRLEVLYSLPEGQEPLVHALRYRSTELGKELRAFRWQAPGAKYGRYYDEAGQELEERLVDSPIDDYEQVTSLLRDGRRHKGVDFKTAVGTPVTMPFDGVVQRRNWNFRGNGNCLEVLDTKGRRVIFLHLEKVAAEARVGARVKKGQQVATAGNTGRSTAPHLHYQLMKGERVLDPFDVHKTVRVGVSAEHKTAYDAEVARLTKLFVGDEVAAR